MSDDCEWSSLDKVVCFHEVVLLLDDLLIDVVFGPLDGVEGSLLDCVLVVHNDSPSYELL